MGGPWANWRDGKLSTRRRAIRRYVLWPCCKPRWRAERRMWPTGRAKCRPRRPPGDGSAPRPAENGCRRARASVGWRGTTYIWIRWRATRRPRHWLGRNAYRRASRRSATSYGSAASWPAWTPAADAAGTPDIGRSPATSAAPESQRLARVVTRVSGRRSHRWATQRKRRHLSDLSDVPPVGSPSARIAVVCAVRTGDHQRAHAGQAVGGTAQGQVDGWISGARV